MAHPSSIDKAPLLQRLLERLTRDLELAEQAQRATQAGATHEESRPENDKDTRALESSYLARGQAKRVLELTGEIQSLRLLEQRAFEPTMPIALSALVELTTDDEGRLTYWLAPAGAGAQLELEGRTVRVVTPRSPLGRALIGRVCGDVVEVQTPQGLVEYEVAAVY